MDFNSSLNREIFMHAFQMEMTPRDVQESPLF